VNHFRLGMFKLKCVSFCWMDHADSLTPLRRKQHYQILYFPLTDPWPIEERNKRKVVTSISCC
jgi:hypothetical protein